MAAFTNEIAAKTGKTAQLKYRGQPVREATKVCHFAQAGVSVARFSAVLTQPVDVGDIKIFVESLICQIYTLQVNLSDTIEIVKSKIQNTVGKLCCLVIFFHFETGLAVH